MYDTLKEHTGQRVQLLINENDQVKTVIGLIDSVQHDYVVFRTNQGPGLINITDVASLVRLGELDRFDWLSQCGFREISIDFSKDHMLCSTCGLIDHVTPDYVVVRVDNERSGFVFVELAKISEVRYVIE